LVQPALKHVHFNVTKYHNHQTNMLLNILKLFL